MNSLRKVIAQIVEQNDIVIVDVGAAYGLPAHLKTIEHVSTLVLFEPHPERARELREWHRKNIVARKVEVVNAALSATGGPRKLYVTNVPTGSSLLRPGSDAGMEFVHASYFFPITEVDIETKKLEEVLVENGISAVSHIKLDVQGGELEVLSGLGEGYGKRLLGVEFEVGFPGGYVHQPQFGTLDELMRSWGMELFDLRLARTHRSKNQDPGFYPSRVFGVPGNSPTLSKRLWEADAIYFRSLNAVLAAGDRKNFQILVSLYCAYGFFVEAYHALERAAEHELFDADESSRLKKLVKDWHRLGHRCRLGPISIPWILSGWPFELLGRMGRFLCGRRAARWIESQ